MSERKKIIKIKADINQIENRGTKKINKIKSKVLKKIQSTKRELD